jgi:hypothetical protein
MATDIASLFGITPQGLSQQRYQQDLKQGYELAQLDPGAAARATLQSGVGQLGRGIAGMMGVEDPQMKLISARQSVIGQLDQTDPASLLKGAKSLSDMGDQQGAFALADYARKAQSEIAQAQQRMAAAQRERQQATPNDIQIAKAIASLRDGITQLEEAEKTPENNRLKNLLTYQLTELERISAKPEKQIAPNIKTVGVAEGTKEAVFLDVNSDQQFTYKVGPDGKQIRQPYVGRVDRVTSTTSVDARPPGEPIKPKDWMDFTQKVLSGDPVMQRTSTILSDAPSAIEIIRNSTSNDFAAASLPTSMALITGQGKNMSNADVNRFARTGGLDDRLAQDAVKFFTGGTTQVKKEQAEKFAVALYRGALIERKKKLQTASEEFGYTDSPNYKIALRNIDDQLAQFKLVKKGETQSSTQKTGNPLVDKWLSTDAEKK